MLRSASITCLSLLALGLVACGDGRDRTVVVNQPPANTTVVTPKDIRTCPSPGVCY